VAVCDVKAESGLRSITRTPLLHTVLPGGMGLRYASCPRMGHSLEKAAGGTRATRGVWPRLDPAQHAVSPGTRGGESEDDNGVLLPGAGIGEAPWTDKFVNVRAVVGRSSPVWRLDRPLANHRHT
jgi:hypothetical protein